MREPLFIPIDIMFCVTSEKVDLFSSCTANFRVFLQTFKNPGSASFRRTDADEVDLGVSVSPLMIHTLVKMSVYDSILLYIIINTKYVKQVFYSSYNV